MGPLTAGGPGPSPRAAVWQPERGRESRARGTKLTLFVQPAAVPGTCPLESAGPPGLYRGG